MLCGKPPHYQKNRKQMLIDIVEKRVEMKSHFSSEAKALLRGLLEQDPKKRLGATASDSAEIKSHPFFTGIDWDKLMAREIEPTFKPFVTGPEDTRNIDKIFLDETARDTPAVSALSPNAKKNHHFDQFTYVASQKADDGAPAEKY